MLSLRVVRGEDWLLLLLLLLLLLRSRVLKLATFR